MQVMDDNLLRADDDDDVMRVRVRVCVPLCQEDLVLPARTCVTGALQNGQVSQIVGDTLEVVRGLNGLNRWVDSW